jgi:hypothetical protein
VFSFFQFGTEPLLQITVVISIGESVSLFMLWERCTMVNTASLQFECDVHCWVLRRAYSNLCVIGSIVESSLLKILYDVQHWYVWYETLVSPGLLTVVNHIRLMGIIIRNSFKIFP